MRDCLRLDESLIEKLTDDARHAVIAQTARVEWRRHEVMPQCVHLHQRRNPNGIAEVISILAARQAWARRRFDGDDTGTLAFLQVLPHEGQRDSAEVAATTRAADHNVRVFPCHLQLLERFLPDHRLMHQHVIQHRAERIFVFPAAGRCRFHRLADGNAE